METKYVFDQQYYVISNQAVALNPLFKNKYYCQRFINRMEKYLSNVCKIERYMLDDDSFQILIRLKDRATIVNYYKKKHALEKIVEKEIPQSTYIFSQCMANLQSSMAKHFNFREKRHGALFCQRFKKLLISDYETFNSWSLRMQAFKKMKRYRLKWENKFRRKNRKKWIKKMKRREWRAGNSFKAKVSDGECFKENENNLQGHFKKPLKMNISRADQLKWLIIRFKIPIPIPNL